MDSWLIFHFFIHTGLDTGGVAGTVKCKRQSWKSFNSLYSWQQGTSKSACSTDSWLIYRFFIHAGECNGEADAAKRQQDIWKTFLIH